MKIGHLNYTVAFDNTKINEKNTDDQRSYAGFSNASDQRIVVRADMQPDYEAETVLHEVMHQCLRAANFDPDEAIKEGCTAIEERTVAVMAGTLLAALRENPELVRYLVGRRG